MSISEKTNGIRKFHYTIWHKDDVKVCSVDVNRKNTFLACGTTDENIYLWRTDLDSFKTSKKKQLQLNIKDSGKNKYDVILRGHRSFVYGLHFTPQYDMLLSSSLGSSVSLWCLKEFKEVQQWIVKPNAEVTDVHISANSQFFATASTNMAHLWCFDQRECIRMFLDDSTDAFENVRIHPNIKYLATSSRSTIKLWSLHTCRDVRTFDAGAFVHRIEFSPNGKQLASCDDAGNVKIWDLASESMITNLISVHPQRVLSIAYNKNGSFLSSGSENGLVNIWENDVSGTNLVDSSQYKHAIKYVRFCQEDTLLSVGV